MLARVGAPADTISAADRSPVTADLAVVAHIRLERQAAIVARATADSISASEPTSPAGSAATVAMETTGQRNEVERSGMRALGWGTVNGR